MTVDPAIAPAKTDFKDTAYYFCCPRCKAKFDEKPEFYLKAPARAPLVQLGGGASIAAPTQAAHADMEYTCPMDPEVRKMGPGECPKCGMALEH